MTPSYYRIMHVSWRWMLWATLNQMCRVFWALDESSSNFKHPIPKISKFKLELKLKCKEDPSDLWWLIKYVCYVITFHSCPWKIHKYLFRCVDPSCHVLVRPSLISNMYKGDWIGASMALWMVSLDVRVKNGFHVQPCTRKHTIIHSLWNCNFSFD